MEQERAAAMVEAAPAELGLEAQRPRPGSFLVRLADERKLATMTWLIVGAQRADSGSCGPAA
jgi:hypothetical protein